MVIAAAKWNQLRGRVVERMKKSYLPSFRDGPKDQTSDAQLRIGECSKFTDSSLRDAPE